MEHIDILVDETNGNYIKDINPYYRYKESGISNDIIALYLQLSHLKNLYRQGYLKVRLGLEWKDRCESVADHSWGLALLAMSIIEKYKLDLDMNKCMKLALVHELGEIYTGDYTPQDGITPDEKHKLERENIKKLLTIVHFENNFLDLWEEFESLATPESLFMKELDKLEFLMQSACYELDVQYLNYSKSQIKSPIMLEILDDLLKMTCGKKIPKDVLERLK